MIQVYTQQYLAMNGPSLFKSLSRSLKQILAFLVFILLVGQQAQAQSAESTFRISSGEKLQDFQLAQLQGLEDASVSFGLPGAAAVNGKATVLAERNFSVPGTYNIRFTRVHFPGQPHGEPGHTCDHYALPEQITVIVNPHRIEYLTETISFSQKLVGGQPTEHITVSIQVNVTGDNVPMPTQFYSSGIETSITGQLNPQQATLSTGTHTLQYQLQGMGKPGTYIQFNFQDANGHDVPCGITTPL